jgi:hypothetical protein
LVRLLSRQRNARPAGVADELIRVSQVRQRSAAPVKPRASHTRVQDELPGVTDPAREEAGSARRHKKRGSGSHEKQDVPAAPLHVHLMYHEEGEDVPRSAEEDEERGATDA